MSRDKLRLMKGVIGLFGVAGVVPLLAGLVSNFSLGQWGMMDLIPVVAGGVLILAGLAANFPAIVRGILTKKALIGTNVIAMVLLATAILSVVSYLNARHYRRFDVTQLRRYTLSEKTKNILKSLEEPVRITTLFTQAQPAPLCEEIMDLLEEYKHQSGKISLEHIDSFFEPAKVYALATRLETDATGLTGNSVIFEAGDRRRDVLYSDMVKEPPPPSPYQYQRQPDPPQLTAEAAFTEAVLSVAEPRQTPIYFLTGQGERSVNDYESGGLSDLVKALKRENYKVEQLNLLAEKEIPKDCGLLIAAASAAPLSGELVVSILDYLANGGRLLAMFEPLSSRLRASGLEMILSTYGVKVRNDVQIGAMGKILRLGSSSVEPFYILNVGSYAAHAVTEGLRGRVSTFVSACMVDAAPQGTVQGYQPTVFLRSPAGYWGETAYAGSVGSIQFDRDVDEKGPVALAVAVEPNGQGAAGTFPDEFGKGADLPGGEGADDPRIVAFGDVEFVTNGLLLSGPGNIDLVLNAVNWLAGKEAHLGIGPREPEQRVANLTPRNQRLIYWLTVAGLPGLCIFLGAFVWLVRRL